MGDSNNDNFILPKPIDQKVGGNSETQADASPRHPENRCADVRQFVTERLRKQ